METLLFVFLSLSYLTVCLLLVSLDKKHNIINSIVLLFLSLFVFFAVNHESQTFMVLNLLWEVWYVLFNGTSYFAHRSSNGKIKLHNYSFLIWGLFVPYNAIFALTCYLFLKFGL